MLLSGLHLVVPPVDLDLDAVVSVTDLHLNRMVAVARN
jgi:hypothetical protein